MGYYTQHLIRIIPESAATVANYKRVAEAIKNEVDKYYGSLRIHDGVMDDSNFNGGDGSKWYLDDKFVDISKHLPDLTIRFEFVGETYSFEPEDGGVVTLKDGKELPGNDDDVDLDAFYEYYGRIKESYIISDDPNEEVVKVPGGMRLSELYKRKIDEGDEE
jgi:hypothetical protein